MCDPFIGEIAVFPYVRPLPNGWLPCDGSMYQVEQYPALYSVIGGHFGGTPGKTFIVPNLKGNVLIGTGRPIGSSRNYTFGHSHGSNYATANLPAHTHQLVKHPPRSSGTTQKVATPATNTELAQFSNSAGTVNYDIFVPDRQKYYSILSTSTFGSAFTGELPHENRQPFLAMSYAIAWDGIYPEHP